VAVVRPFWKVPSVCRRIVVAEKHICQCITAKHAGKKKPDDGRAQTIGPVQRHGSPADVDDHGRLANSSRRGSNHLTTGQLQPGAGTIRTHCAADTRQSAGMSATTIIATPPAWHSPRLGQSSVCSNVVGGSRMIRVSASSHQKNRSPRVKHRGLAGETLL